MSRPATEVTFRPVRSDDSEIIQALLRRVMGPDSRAGEGEYFAWKHQANAFGPSLGLVAEAGGEMVGVRLFMRWRFTLGGTSVPAVRAVDTATSPAWRGRGLFTRLTTDLLEECREKGIAFVFNTPNSKSWPGYRKMGWSEVCRVRVLFRISRPIRAAIGNSEGEGKTPVAQGDTVQTVLQRIESRGAVVNHSNPQLATARDVAYLKWRYRDAPGLEYRAISSQRGGLTALVFRLRMRRGRRELMICEVFSAVGREAETSQLIERAVRENRPDYTIALAARGTSGRAALRRSGFVSVPWIGPRLTVRPLESDLSVDPANWRSWRLSLGDLELF